MPATAIATGPRTETGKATSSRNAIRHGLTAKQIVLPGEGPAEYEELRQSLITAHQPAEGLESILTDQIAQCVWRLDRSRRMEAAALEQGLIHNDPAASARLDKITRYMASIEREFHRSVRELTNLQSIRARNAAVEEKASSQRNLAQLQKEFRDCALGVPDIPPLTEEDVTRILAGAPDIENYETNPAETHRVLPATPNIQELQNEPGSPLPAGAAHQFRHARIQL